MNVYTDELTNPNTGGSWIKCANRKYYGVGYQIPDSLRRFPIAKNACIYRLDPVSEGYKVLYYPGGDKSALRDDQFWGYKKFLGSGRIDIQSNFYFRHQRCLMLSDKPR